MLLAPESHIESYIGRVIHVAFTPSIDARNGIKPNFCIEIKHLIVQRHELTNLASRSCIDLRNDINISFFIGITHCVAQNNEPQILD
jgi:hypothetical protein